MMNPFEEAALDSIIARLGIGAVLMHLSRKCVAAAHETPRLVRRMELETAARMSDDAAHLANIYGESEG